MPMTCMTGTLQSKSTQLTRSRSYSHPLKLSSVADAGITMMEASYDRCANHARDSLQVNANTCIDSCATGNFPTLGRSSGVVGMSECVFPLPSLPISCNSPPLFVCVCLHVTSVLDVCHRLIKPCIAFQSSVR